MQGVTWGDLCYGGRSGHEMTTKVDEGRVILLAGDNQAGCIPDEGRGV